MLTRNHRGIRTRKTSAALVAIGLAVLSIANQANAATIYKTEDWTSWEQLYSAGAPNPISNNGDFYVDGSLGKNILCGAGLLKNGNIIGHWSNNAYGLEWGEWFAGSVNVDPTINSSVNNPNALGIGERNNGMWGTLDANGDGDWGYLDFWDNGMIDVHFDDYELILDQQGILVNDVRGDFSTSPRYLGSGGGMENAGKFDKIEFDSSYAIPEPLTLSLLIFGSIALLRPTSRRKHR